MGTTLLEDPHTAGIAFTGSYQVGMNVVRGAAREHPRPVVVEMGGKNPAIVTAAADLDAAAEGIAKSAFGFGGQKCSACSRVYVVESVAQEFLDKLVQRAGEIKVGNPLEREVYLGPLIHAKAVATFERWVEQIRVGGGEIAAGGHVLTGGDLARGNYVEPTVALVPDATHAVWSEELFVPILAVRAVADFDEALAAANRSRYGLTAGIFSRDPAEVRRFLDGIEAGVTYVNRRSGATTGAWPGVNPFGGWKGSGACGPAALGPHYLLKFLREQSRTINEVEL
ncbi:MAG: aldehyde dehydrogenase family protein [Thermoanaerobaculia bacterium]